MPLGLNAMLATALSKMDECGIKPHEIVFGNGDDFRLRAQDAILLLHNGNALAHECFPRQPIDAWQSFLQWHEWWSLPHWANRSTHDKDYYAQCADCGKTTKGAEWPEKCVNGACPSHAKWALVNGVAAS